MKARLTRPATVDGLFVWVMHRFAEVFEEHAIVKGGIALRLLDCPRSTTDIDYVFVPFGSKNDIVGRLRAVLAELDDADVDVRVHSKTIRAVVRVDAAAIQIEANVDFDCPSFAVPTTAMAIPAAQPARLVRVVAIERALANKLAAWNERRLLRDLFDVYYLAVRLGAVPELAILQQRLQHVESRLPALRRRKVMTLAQLLADLRAALLAIDDTALAAELGPILPPQELAGLVPRLRAGVSKVVEGLEPFA